jgi:hypothetical protein
VTVAGERAGPAWVVPVLGAAIAAVLSSGVTAVYLHETAPELFAAKAPLQVAPELRDLAGLLVAPERPYRALNAGTVVDLASQGASAQGLASLGFRRGWTQAWGVRKNRVDTFVMEFTSPTGAAAYAHGIGRAAKLLLKPAPFTVTGVPDASGLRDTVRDRDGRYAQVIVLFHGSRAALLVFSDVTPQPPAELVALARAQYEALAAP